ncbi:MAG: permease [Ignavibacteriales bacterium]
MGIFLLQFLMKAADKLVGKGLDFIVIFELIAYNLAWMVVLVIPMAVLVATLMAFGSMSQNNEITVMKSAGVSLYRMMLGPFVASIVVAGLLISFNNDVLPDANHQAKILMFEISQKKPTLSIEPGIFSQEVNNTAILVRDINRQTGMMNQITLYDYSDPAKINIVTAESGKLYFTADMTKLIMDLNNGEIHETDQKENGLYRKLLFTRHKITMNADQFSIQSSGIGSHRGDRELSAEDMWVRVDSLMSIRNSYFSLFMADVNRYFIGDSLEKRKPFKTDDAAPPDFRNMITKLQAQKNLIISSSMRVDMMQGEADKYLVEIHKKYSIPVACIIFILLGSPLGIMTRKGGFGMAASISLFFFLIYWAFLIGGEKLADRGMVTPLWGMWSANLLMGVLGIVLTNKTAKETINLDFTFLKKLIPKKWRSEENNETT